VSCSRLLLAASATALLASACGEPSVGLRLRFPSRDTFVESATAQIDVYPGDLTGEQSPDAICRALSRVALTSVSPLKSTGPRDPCALAAGVALEGVGTGRRVIFAQANDDKPAAILRGCAVVDISGVPDPEADEESRNEASAAGVARFIEVQLATLPEYPAEPRATAKCSFQEKCEPGAVCF